MQFRTTLTIAATLGLTAVAAGTFGAHVLKDRVEPDLIAVFETGARYHAYHALAILAMCGFIDRLGKAGGVAVWLFAVGTVIFAGTLYALAITGQRRLGAVTPIGGLLLMAGWATLIVTAMRRERLSTTKA